MRRILHNLMRIPEADPAHIQPLRPTPSDQILRVERRVLGRDPQVSQHDVVDVLRAMHVFARGCAVLRGGDGGREGKRGHFCGILSF